MENAHERAYAKINLTLDVLGKREDGYHEMCMVMESVDVCDELRFTEKGEGITVKTNLSFLPEDGNNLAAKAAARFAEETGIDVTPLEIEIEKHIPVCAGTAGGSSDAAAVLRWLNRRFEAGLSTEALAALGAKVGADVSYCVGGGTALAEGKGEKLTALPGLPECWLVLCKPGFSVSTPALFAELDKHKIRRRPDTAGVRKALEEGDLVGVARRLYNVFEDVLPPWQRTQVEHIKNTLVSQGALGAAMSGTGPTAFGIFETEALAREACQTLKEEFEDTFLCKNVKRLG